MEDDQAPLSDQLKAAHDEARRLRCESFVDYRATIAGIVLQPITLRSYNALIAFGNAFVMGSAPGLADVINFVWLHHKDFGQFNTDAKRRVSRQVADALTPSFRAGREFLQVVSTFERFRWLRRFAGRPVGAIQEDAVSEIRRLIAEARGDFPISDDAAEPPPFAMHAHFLNLFRRELGMTFEETEALPLKQATQHYREIIHHMTRGKALLLTRSEAEIWREHLKAPEPASK